jgi:LmbE family N-acetylglucosaminyl deacetylase
LVLSPHPDDEAIGCGGALHLHSRAGDSVEVIYLTSGEAAGRREVRQETSRTREQEAARVAAILGLKKQSFWRLPDGKLRAREADARRLAGLLGDSRPDEIYVTHAGEQHADHRAARRLLSKALALVDVEAYHPYVWEFEVWTPLQSITRAVDISDCLEIKLQAVRAYASQCRLLRFAQAVKGLARYRGEMHSWPGGDYAEVFAGGRA